MLLFCLTIYSTLLAKSHHFHFDENKTKSVLFASKRRPKNIRQLNIKYKDINIKQHSEVQSNLSIVDTCGS